jgi:hypothetical protein
VTSGPGHGRGEAAPPGRGRLSALGTRVGALGGRRALVMADQATSSLSNIVVTIIVARQLVAEQFGAFSVALLAYQLALAAGRAVVGEPWLSVHSADEGRTRDRAAADLLHAAVAVSLACALVIGVGGLALGGDARTSLLALAVVYPFLGTQDALRFVAVVDRPRIALGSDLTWLVTVVALMAVAPADASPAWFVLAWGVAGGLGLVVPALTLGLSPRSGDARRWWGRHRAMAGAYLAEAASARAVAHVLLLGLGAIAGLSALGAVRAAQVFYGPLNTLFDGVYLALVPDGVRRRDDPGRLMRLMVAATVLVTGLALAWLVVGLVLPDSWGSRLFGDTWAEAEDVMLPIGLSVVAGSLATGAFGGLRSLAAARLSLKARLWSLPPQVVAALVGSATAAAVGYSVGLAIGKAVMAAIWWVVFLTALRRRVAPPEEATAEAYPVQVG